MDLILPTQFKMLLECVLAEKNNNFGDALELCHFLGPEKVARTLVSHSCRNIIPVLSLIDRIGNPMSSKRKRRKLVEQYQFRNKKDTKPCDPYIGKNKSLYLMRCALHDALINECIRQDRRDRHYNNGLKFHRGGRNEGFARLAVWKFMAGNSNNCNWC